MIHLIFKSIALYATAMRCQWLEVEVDIEVDIELEVDIRNRITNRSRYRS